MLAFLDKIPFGTPLLRRIAFWLLTAFLTYVLIGFFVIPPIIKAVVTDQVTAQLRRETTIERVYFNPLTFRIEIDKFNVAKLKGEGALLHVGSFTAAPDPATFLEFAPVIGHLHLRDLTLDIAFFGDGKYSISDLMGSRVATEDEEPEATDPNKPIFPFALYGFELTNATINFDDQPHGKKHVISDLNLLVPFTSSILDKRKEYTQPKFTAVVNGDPVELKGRTLPFDDSLLTEFELGAVDVDLHQYWGYVPIDSPLVLDNGHFTSNISLFFQRPPGERMSLFLGGGGSLTNMELSTPEDGKVLTLKEASFQMEKYSLGDNQLILDSLRFDQPYFKVIRHKKGDINWVAYFPGSAQQPEATKESPADATAKSAPAATDTAGPEDTTGTDNTTGTDPAAPFRLDIKSLVLSGGSVDWIDQAVKGGFKRNLTGLSIKGTDISTAGETPIQYEIAAGNAERISAQGAVTLTPMTVKGTAAVQDLSIPDFGPYLAELPMQIDSGVVNLSARYDIKQENDTTDLGVTEGTLSVSDFAMRKPGAKKPSIGFGELAVSGTSMDLATRTVLVSRVDLTKPMVKVIRHKSGDIDLVKTFAGDGKKEPQQDDTTAGDAAPWTATINEIRLTEGAASFRDNGLAHPTTLSVSRLRVNLDNISTAKGTVAKYDVSTRWGGRGIIATYGTVALDTFKTQGQLKLRKMGLSPLDGYLGESTELLLAKGALTTDIKYTFSGTEKGEYTLGGNVNLADLQLKDYGGEGEFAGIDELKLTDFRFANEPFRLGVADIHLNGPRAAIDIDANGRMNINRLFRIPEPQPAATDEEAAQEAESEGTEPEEAEKPKASTLAESDLPSEEEPMIKGIDIGKITMENGRVNFRDQSVEPDFDTTISEMTLDLSDIAQTQEARPKVDFSARIGPTPVSVKGVVNPVITPIYSDLVINVGGLEMVPLTPYTIKNLAYPIEKGRLHADVTFKTEDWALNAENKFFIEQLVLGAKDDNPDAPDIPVKFGLALLQDSNGDLNLNLPIDGRLDDPNFQIGGIIFKAIATLFFKALASPFSLIGSMFEGGEEMDFVLFEPGRHAINAESTKKLESLTKVLVERQKLNVEVDGVVDPVADKAGLTEVAFEAMIKQEKFDSLSRTERAGTSAEAMVIQPEEYEDLLFEVYADAPDPDSIKPTTLFVTDRQPPEVMKKFITDRIEITEDDLTDLARVRAAAIKEHIISLQPELSGRVYLLDRREDKPAKAGTAMHRADLGIK